MDLFLVVNTAHVPTENPEIFLLLVHYPRKIKFVPERAVSGLVEVTVAV